ncbi:MAG: methyl-accepting chemotaxis protein, partial [Pseudomonadota bacterium]
MNDPNRPTVSRKLTATFRVVRFLFLCCVGLLIGTGSLYIVSASKARDLRSNEMNVMAAFNTWQIHADQARTNAILYAATGDAAAWAKYVTAAVARSGHADGSARKEAPGDQFGDIGLTPSELEQVASLQERFKDLARIEMDAFGVSDIRAEPPENSKARMPLSSPAYVRAAALASEELTTLSGTASTRMMEDLRRTEVWGSAWLLASATLSLTIVGLMTYALKVGPVVIQPVQRMSEAMRDILAGKQDVSIRGTRRDDEIGMLARSVSVFKEKLLSIAEMETRLRAVLEAALSGSDTVADAATRLSQLAEEIETVAAREAEAVKIASAAVEEMSETMRVSSEDTRETEMIATAAAAEAETSGR